MLSRVDRCSDVLAGCKDVDIYSESSSVPKRLYICTNDKEQRKVMLEPHVRLSFLAGTVRRSGEIEDVRTVRRCMWLPVCNASLFQLGIHTVKL